MPKPAVAEVPDESAVDVVKRAQEILGVSRLRSDQDFVRLVEARLPRSALDGLRQAGLSESELHTLIVPRRTLAHRRTRREPLSRDESDRAVRVARVAALAERVFGEHDRAWRWLRRGTRPLGGRSPLELLTTEAGARLVEELLYRIDDGLTA